MPYERYLQTAHWRKVRNRALHLAGHRCSKCETKRDLQVHHKTYERRGVELDDDLDVLCRGCHLGLHVEEVQHGIGVYLKLVSAALDAATFEGLADLLEDVKCRCALARIPYSGGQVHAAVARVERDRKLNFGAQAPSKYAELLDAGVGQQPLTHAEACGLIAKFHAQGCMKPMPTVRPMTPRQADRKIALRQVAELILDQVETCNALEAEAESSS